MPGGTSRAAAGFPASAAQPGLPRPHDRLRTVGDLQLGQHVDVRLRVPAAVRGGGLVLALDAFWPLSMVGMFLIGIAVAGRWTGAARWWPLGAESWAPVDIPVAQIAPDAVAYTAGGHLLVGYVALGIVLAARPHLTGAR
jgi:hypothetical protein